jgi:tripartite-type tricarboxylate transporter receptor subunit TctC
MMISVARFIVIGACALCVTPGWAQAYPAKPVRVVLWSMLLVPAATPKEVVARLNREAVKAIEAADVRERYAGTGVEPAGSTPERAGAYLNSETEKYAKVVKAIGLRIV